MNKEKQDLKDYMCYPLYESEPKCENCFKYGHYTDKCRGRSFCFYCQKNGREGIGHKFLECEYSLKYVSDRFNEEMLKGWWKIDIDQGTAMNIISTKIMDSCYRESQILQRNYEKNKKRNYEKNKKRNYEKK